jgi:hypothetical protein
MKKIEPIESAFLPPHIRDKIANPADLPKGRAGWSREQTQASAAKRQEIPEQKTFASWLNLMGLPFYNPRSDKRSTIRAGAADFTVFGDEAKTIFIEFKAPGCTQSPDQIKFEREVTGKGFEYQLVYSAHEAIELCRKFFQL